MRERQIKQAEHSNRNELKSVSAKKTNGHQCAPVEQQKELRTMNDHWKRSEKRHIFFTALLWIRKEFREEIQLYASHYFHHSASMNKQQKRTHLF